jgi:hypothetical protein
MSPSCRSYCGDEMVVSYLPVLASGSGDRAYRRPFTRSSHLSSAARPYAILNARRAIRDLAPQTPSAGPFRNRSSISRFCAAMISLGGGFNLLAPCSGATACGFAASALFPWNKTGSIAIDKRAAPPMKTAIIPIPVCRSSLCRNPSKMPARCPVSLCRWPVSTLDFHPYLIFAICRDAARASAVVR